MVGQQNWQAQKARCVNDHLLEGDNIRQVGNKRRCKVCDAMRSRRSRAAKRQDGDVSVHRPRPEPISFPHLEYAVCASEDPSLWDDRLEGEDNEERDLRVDLAKRMCRKCPSQIQCRAYQLEMRDRQPVFGVWGGVLFEAPSVYARKRKAS